MEARCFLPRNFENFEDKRWNFFTSDLAGEML